MLKYKEERLRLWSGDEQEHRTIVLFASTEIEAILGAYYESGGADAASGARIVQWSASYEPSNQFDEGCAHIGKGRIDLEIASMRGIGLGSLLMRPLVSWIKDHEKPVPVASITLSADDAKTVQERNIRNRFYTKLGFKFRFEDANETWGESYPLLSSGLVVPPFKLSREWNVESTTGIGEIF